jgi:hypothetical protein
LTEKSKFIFVPGTSDPASPNILPRWMHKHNYESYDRRDVKGPHTLGFQVFDFKI